jgi:hypothetical protein
LVCGVLKPPLLLFWGFPPGYVTAAEVLPVVSLILASRVL